jgi:hypothetical protein
VAVEVAIQLGMVAETPEGTDEPEPVEIAESGEPLAREISPEPQGPVYRLVIDMPGSPTHGAPRRARPVTTRPPPRPAPRRIAPRRLPPAEPAVRPLADEWMRTSS